MSHHSTLSPDHGGTVTYGWRHAGASFALHAQVSGPARPLEPGSAAEFITEHYWGYTRQRDGGTIEYQVEHPPWRIWSADDAHFAGLGVQLYGEALGGLLTRPPTSAFVAVGSHVSVHAGRRLT